MSKPDFGLLNCGNISILTPQTKTAREWITAHLPADITQWGGGVVVEHRYVDDVLDGIAQQGLVVE